jgi:transcriptional regulator with XRE-family HTH domain
MQQGWSQRELADQTRGLVTDRTLRNWEGGVHVPYPGAQVRAIALVLRTTPGFLFTGEEDA